MVECHWLIAPSCDRVKHKCPGVLTYILQPMTLQRANACLDRASNVQEFGPSNLQAMTT